MLLCGEEHRTEHIKLHGMLSGPSLAHLRLPSACHMGAACKVAFLILDTYQLFTSLAPLVRYLIEFTMATVHLASKS